MSQQSQSKVDPNHFYPKLQIHRAARRWLWCAVPVTLVAVTILVFMTRRHADLSWQAMSLPLIAIGLLLSLIPQSETWLYRPWQNSPRQYEKLHHYPRY